MEKNITLENAVETLAFILEEMFDTDVNIDCWEDYKSKGLNVNLTGYELTGDIDTGAFVTSFAMTINDETAEVSLMSNSFPLDLDGLIDLNTLNAVTDFKASYIDSRVFINGGKVPFDKENPLSNIMEILLKLINDELVSSFLIKNSQQYICSKCGGELYFFFEHGKSEAEYYCSKCGKTHSIKEVTGRDDFIAEFVKDSN